MIGYARQTIMSIIEARRNNGTQHFVIQTGTGVNFEKGTSISIGKKVKLARARKTIEGLQQVGYYAVPYGLKTAKHGDKIWFVKSNDNQFAYAVAEVVSVSSDRTFTDTEMGWNREGSECPYELVYTNLVNVRDCQIQIMSGQPGMCIVRNYKNSTSITADLPAEFDRIQRYINARVQL